MAFDIEKEHGEVVGFGRARYFQNDKYYASDGTEIHHSEKGYEIDNEGNENIPEETNKSGDEVTVELEALNWREIKEKVIESGGEWQGSKAEGIDFLRSLDG